jgi:hypothetical protein
LPRDKLGVLLLSFASIGGQAHQKSMYLTPPTSRKSLTLSGRGPGRFITPYPSLVVAAIPIPLAHRHTSLGQALAREEAHR